MPDVSTDGATPSTRSPRRMWTLALVCLLVVIAYGTMSADGQQSRTRQLFGLWRTRHALVLAAGLWLTATFALTAVSRRALLRWLLVGCSVLFTVGVLEVVGLVGGVDYAALFGHGATSEVGSARRPHAELRGETYQDTYLRWGIESDPIPFEFRTDGNGFRNAEDRDAADV